ncbi:short-chain dehydrogenase [Fluviicola chungangensis]|uniref:Short-chain dehydrogenase n=1 Tax=Fluviicola chungangensis TaxID=2597671 RepID=A0A556N362_9FLAO|nr:short-chain dehydrogenase [Fluviicola chungangensis]TSJ46515.1 short-chain dehydrogenase [Fluviicola chungangensis]
MKKLLYLSLLLLFAACSSEKTDEELLEQDRVTLNENLISGKVVPYKYVKLMFRGYASDDTTSVEFKAFKHDSDQLVRKMMKLNRTDELSVKDYWAMYQLYDKMDEFVKQTDEDAFPVIADAFRRYWDGTKSAHYFKGKAKAEQEAREHAFLTVLAMASQSLGTEIALYECAETDIELLPDSELKGNLRFLRGFVFMQKGLYYLSENEYSENLEWLKKNKDRDLTYTMNAMQLGKFDQKQSVMAYRAMNHLYRGVDRLMMEREIDYERALEDFDQVLKDCRRLEIDNEAVWAIEVYVTLEKGNTDKAIASLEKLKKSKLLTSDDKELIDESIGYLEKDDSETVLKEVYDKVFMLKIASAFTFSRLKDLNTNRLLKKSKVPNASKIAKKTKVLEDSVEQINNFSNGETLKDATKKVGEEGENLLEEVKGIFN